jgi:hypothetical protein
MGWQQAAPGKSCRLSTLIGMYVGSSNNAFKKRYDGWNTLGNSREPPANKRWSCQTTKRPARRSLPEFQTTGRSLAPLQVTLACNDFLRSFAFFCGYSSSSFRPSLPPPMPEYGFPSSQSDGTGGTKVSRGNRTWHRCCHDRNAASQISSAVSELSGSR